MYKDTVICPWELGTHESFPCFGADPGDSFRAFLLSSAIEYMLLSVWIDQQFGGLCLCIILQSRLRLLNLHMWLGELWERDGTYNVLLCSGFEIFENVYLGSVE